MDWKIKGALIVVAIGAVLLCLRRQPEEITTLSSHEEHKVTAVTSRTRVHQVETKKPDGTKVTETTTEKDEAKVVEKAAESNIKVQSEPKSQYRIGLDYLPSLTSPPRASDVAIRAGARLGDSPVWIEVGIDLKHKQGSIGISAEF